MKKRFDCYKFLTVFTLFLMPISISILIVMLNNYEKYDSTLKTAILLLNVAFLTTFIYSFLNMIKQKRIINTNRIIIKFAVLLLFVAYVFEIGTMIKFVYYDDNFKDWLITSSASTINHKGLATKIYSKYTVDEVLENKEEIEPDLIDFSVDYDISLYANEYEKEILEREEGALYKLIQFKYNGFDCHMIAIYDPTRIEVGFNKNNKKYGKVLTDILKSNNAILGINGGGYRWSTGYPLGLIVHDGKIIYSSSTAKHMTAAINYDGVLMVGKISAKEVKEKNIKEAVSFGPALIVNGKAATFKGTGGSGLNPRTVIAQRKDGIVLFLVVNGYGSRLSWKGRGGVYYTDLITILQRYGAYNAANMDGGSSATMVINGKLINDPCDPVKDGQDLIRSAWMLK